MHSLCFHSKGWWFNLGHKSATLTKVYVRTCMQLAVQFAVHISTSTPRAQCSAPARNVYREHSCVNVVRPCCTGTVWKCPPLQESTELTKVDHEACSVCSSLLYCTLHAANHRGLVYREHSRVKVGMNLVHLRLSTVCALIFVEFIFCGFSYSWILRFLIRGCWPLFRAYPLMSKVSQIKLSQMAANLRKLQTLNLSKFKVYTAYIVVTV